MRSWDDLRDDLEHIAYQKGITNTAHMIPSCRKTVYRLINGETQTPSRAMRDCVERMVERQKSCHLTQPDNTATD